MISLIICSRNQDISLKLKNNIKETIGQKYELIVIDNSNNKHSIFSAYNEGVRRSKYPYLCFMHEDILYHTMNWGKLVVKHFKHNNLGLIGVIGGHYLPKCPASWWTTEYRSGQIIQGYLDENNKYQTESNCWLRYKHQNSNSKQVVSVDGLWFCVPTKMFDKINFDELNFNGFHCYDADICLQVNKLGYEVNVIFDILIEHFSCGAQNYEFLNERIKFFKKWESYLPLIKGIEISEYDIEDRLLLAEKINELAVNQFKEIELIRNTFAYKLGIIIIVPLKKIRNLFRFN